MASRRPEGAARLALWLSPCSHPQAPPALCPTCWPSLKAGLQELALAANAFARLPPTLAAATALESLDLSDCRSLTLAVAEVESVILRRMPRLRTLSLGGARGAQPSWAQLRRAVR